MIAAWSGVHLPLPNGISRSSGGWMRPSPYSPLSAHTPVLRLSTRIRTRTSQQPQPHPHPHKLRHTHSHPLPRPRLRPRPHSHSHSHSHPHVHSHPHPDHRSCRILRRCWLASSHNRLVHVGMYVPWLCSFRWMHGLHHSHLQCVRCRLRWFARSACVHGHPSMPKRARPTAPNATLTPYPHTTLHACSPKSRRAPSQPHWCTSTFAHAHDGRSNMGASL